MNDLLTSSPPADAPPSPKAEAASPAPFAPPAAFVPSRSRRRLLPAVPLAFNMSGGLLLLLCVALPMLEVPGCRGSPPSAVYPYQLLPEAWHFGGQLILWHYLLGLLVAAGAGAMAWTASARPCRILWHTYLAVGCLLVSLAWGTVGISVLLDQAALDDFFTPFPLLVSLPTLTVPAVLLATFLFSRTWTAAVAWVQAVLAATSIAWFATLWLLLEFDLLFGAALAAAAGGVIVLGSLLVRWQGAVGMGLDPAGDARDPPRRYSLRSLLVGVTACAVLCGLMRLLGPWVIPAAAPLLLLAVVWGVPLRKRFVARSRSDLPAMEETVPSATGGTVPSGP